MTTMVMESGGMQNDQRGIATVFFLSIQKAALFSASFSLPFTHRSAAPARRDIAWCRVMVAEPKKERKTEKESKQKLSFSFSMGKQKKGKQKEKKK